MTAPLLALLVALLLLLLVVRLLTTGSLQWRNAQGRQLAMREIDLPALRNLLSREENEFLRISLSPSAYRKVRRARISAVQQYMEWIAENCATLLRIIELNRNQEQQSGQDRSGTLAAEAVRLRAASLALWLLLGLQYVFPALDFTPISLVRKYDQLSGLARSYLSSTEAAGKPLTHSA